MTNWVTLFYQIHNLSQIDPIESDLSEGLLFAFQKICYWINDAPL